MKVVGSVIARLGSKRLPFKNILPFNGVPLVRLGILKLLECDSVDEVVLSTESELIARQVDDLKVHILKRPDDLAGDEVPSVPVFQHIVNRFPCDVHVNYNINFPRCEKGVIDRAVQLAAKNSLGESLSVPFAAWAQTSSCLANYEDPWNITAEQFEDSGVREPDVHTLEDLISAHQIGEIEYTNWSSQTWQTNFKK